MYLDFFRLKRHPFRITPDPSLFFAGGSHGRGVVLDALVYGITTGEGILKVVGEVGSGKTMLCRMLEERLPSNVEIVYLANPNLSARDIIYAIAFELRLDVEASTDRLVVMHRLQDYLLKRHAEGATVVVFIEEAQSMPLDTLEEVRLLSNLETHRHKLMQIVLFGQPELDRKLGEKSIRQLRERITHSFYLDPLNEDEIREYLHFRLQTAGCPWPQLFHPKAEKLLCKASDGLTRRINILADKSLLAAYADPATRPELRNSAGEIQSMVLPGHVRVAIADSGYGSNWPVHLQSLWKYGAAIVAGCVLSAGFLLFWQGRERDAPLVTAPQVIEQATVSETVNIEARQQIPVASGTVEAGVALENPAPDEMPADAGQAHTEISIQQSDNQTVVSSTTLEAETGINTPDPASAPVNVQPEIAEEVMAVASPGIIATAEPESEQAVEIAANRVDISTPQQTGTAPEQDQVAVLPQSGGQSQARPFRQETGRTTVSPPAPPLAALMMDRSTVWQASLSTKQGYSIQMISIPTSETFTLQEYLEFLELSGMLDKSWLCLISANNRRREQWLVFHNEFDGLSSARNYIDSLPPYLGQHSPYARNLGDIACSSH